MDDGAKNTAMSIDMLNAMRQQGTDVVLATSHYYAGRESIDSFLQRREDAWQHLQQVLQSGNEELQGLIDSRRMTVLPGAEAAFFFGMEEKEGVEKLCIQGTDVLLVEMPFGRWTSAEYNALSSLILDRKLQVVLAHLERFLEFNQNNPVFDSVLRLPLTIQVNAEAVLPLFGRGPALKLFKNGTASLLGSDAHNLSSRAPNLAKGRQMIEKKCGPQTLQRIDETGNRLLSSAL